MLCETGGNLPQGLKPLFYLGFSGTAEAMPYQIAFTRPVPGTSAVQSLKDSQIGNL